MNGKNTVRSVLIVAIALLAANLSAQENSYEIPAYPRAIEDNSYFIEEAYNQEDRVVQHISNAIYRRKPQRDFVYSFTQEWPAFGQKHQLSYTMPYLMLDSNAIHGIGDLMINYRYQLTDHDAWATLAPRLSVIFPTADESRGIGNGTTAWQVNLPASKRLNALWVTHFNLGATLYPDMQTPVGNGRTIKKNLTEYWVGGSLIALVRQNFNMMMEIYALVSEEFDDSGKVNNVTETVISPGLRYAIDIGNLQIVPGVAMPVVFSGGESETGIFTYLSLEHPF